MNRTRDGAWHGKHDGEEKRFQPRMHADIPGHWPARDGLVSRSGRQTGETARNIRVHPRASAVETLFSLSMARIQGNARARPGSPDYPGVDHVLFPAGWPFAPNKPAADWPHRIPISATGRATIASGNARRILKP